MSQQPAEVRTTEAPLPLPPNDDTSERALLGAILLDPSVLQSLPNLDCSMFWLEKHQAIYTAMQQVARMGQGINFVSVISQLEQQKKFEVMGGPAYLTALLNAVDSVTAAPTYYRRMLRSWVQRRLLGAAGQIAELAYSNHQAPAEELVLRAEQILHGVELPSIEEGVQIGKALETFMPELDKRLADPRLIYGTPTGLDLDADTGGMLAQDLWVCAGDPGKGKTSLSLTVATNAARVDPEQNGIAFFSLEMTLEALLYRWTAAAADLDSRLLRQGRIRAQERKDLPGKVSQLMGLPIYIFDKGQDTGSIRANVARLLQHVPIKVVMIDYSRLLRDRLRGDDNETARIGYISGMSKEIAKDLGVTVWLNHVLVRSAFDKKPTMADLGWSYQMAFDVDVLLFPWFPQERKDMSANIGLGKSRNGPAGQDLPMIFDAAKHLWRNPVRQPKQSKLEEALI